MRSAILLTLTSLLLSGVAWADVTGVSTFNNGEAVTISGSGFGTKSTPAPVLFDDFEGGTAGSTLGTNGWTVRSDNVADKRPVFSNSSQRAGSGLSAYLISPVHNLVTDQRDIIWQDGLGLTAGNRMVWSFWVRSNYNGANRVASGDPKQWKIARLSSGPYGDDTYPELAQVWNTNGHYIEYSNGSDGTHISSCSTYGGNGWNHQSYSMPTISANTWTHYMYVAQLESAQNACDGSLAIYVNGEYKSSRSGLSMSGNGGPLQWDEIWLGEYVQDNSVEYTQRFDDVYVDNSWARVELCTGSTYSNRGSCEIQVPSSWSSGSVTIQARTGAFSTNDTAYLYVTDSNGTTLPSYAVTIGQQGATLEAYCINADGDDFHNDTCGNYASNPGGDYVLLSTLAGGGDCVDNNPAINPGSADPCNDCNAGTVCGGAGPTTTPLRAGATEIRAGTTAVITE